MVQAAAAQNNFHQLPDFFEAATSAKVCPAPTPGPEAAAMEMFSFSLTAASSSSCRRFSSSVGLGIQNQSFEGIKSVGDCNDDNDDDPGLGFQLTLFRVLLFDEFQFRPGPV